MFLKLQSNEGDIIAVSPEIIMFCGTLRSMLWSCGGSAGDQEVSVIPLPNVSTRYLELVLQWIQHHLESDEGPWNEETIQKYCSMKASAWDEQFLNMEQSSLCGLIMAANYLDVAGLYDMSCKVVADRIHGKSAEELRQFFHIKK